ncbi:flocculation protein FLO11-like [Quercus suber]|uniref:flocculation protein FLO11-like n=1 Tax=Quercus suber TaxID=58331 RepID=UPI0032E03C51
MGWKRNVKVVNLPTPAKKGLVSQTTKPKSAKIGDDSSETCSNIVPYEGGLPPIGNIVLEGSPPPFARTRSNKHSTASKPKPSTPRLSMDAPPSNKTCGSKRKTSAPVPSTTTKRKSKHKEDTSTTCPILLDKPKLEVMPFVSTVAQRAPTKAPIPPPKPVPVEESAQAESVGEFAPIPAKTPTLRKKVTPASASYTGSASSATHLVISASDPFIALSQAI